MRPVAAPARPWGLLLQDVVQDVSWSSASRGSVPLRAEHRGLCAPRGREQGLCTELHASTVQGLKLQESTYRNKPVLVALIQTRSYLKCA